MNSMFGLHNNELELDFGLDDSFALQSEFESPISPARAGPTFHSIAPRLLTYSTRDVLDNRISVPAQHSLVRLSKNKATSVAAVGLLEAVKAGRLVGIKCVNWDSAAKRAERLGKTWWTVIPRGEDAVLLLDPDNLTTGAPLVAFPREIDKRNKYGCGSLPSDTYSSPSPARLDIALTAAWKSFNLWSMGQLKICRDENLWTAEAFSSSPIRNVIPKIYCLRDDQIIPVSYEMPIELTAWAESTYAPGLVCRDARLNGGNTSHAYPGGSSRGQAGWDWGFRYSSLMDLTNKLTAGSPPHCVERPPHTCHPIHLRPLLGYCPHFIISRLGIVAHGFPGKLEVNGPKTSLLTANTASTVYKKMLDSIEVHLAPNAAVLFYGCNAGAGDAGSALLKELSKRWFGRRVVAFTTVMAFGWGRMRSGKQCSEAGLRDTSCFNSSGGEDVERKRYSKDWTNLLNLPWGSEVSPHAKIALNGRIIKDPGMANTCNP